jgi:putative ABC transport system permease protein
MQKLLQDLRYAARTMVKNPGFTLIAVLTLALGIGANTAIFSVVNAVLLRPLPFKNSDQLVAVLDRQPGDSLTPASYPEYLDWREQKQAFAGVSAFAVSSYVLTAQGVPEQIRALRVSAAYLPMLGITPMLGRALRPEEEDISGDRVVLLGYAIWKSRFGSDPTIAGKTMELDEQTYTIVGVLPREFKMPRKTEVLLGLRMDPRLAVRGLHFLNVIARLRQGLTVEQARKEIEPVAMRLQKERSTPHGIALVSWKENLVQSADTPLVILLCAVGFVLLIACANIANLLLARAVKRKREIAVRIAIGAGRWRLVRQLLTESLLLGVAGGVIGLAVAEWGVQVLVRVFAERLPRYDEIAIDTHVLAFVLGISLLTGILFGLAPAWESLKVSLYDTLKEGGRQGGHVSARKRNALVIAEVAVSLVLSTGAGLLIRSFQQLLHVNKGFAADNTVTFAVNLPHNRYSEPARQASFFRQLLERLKNLPGVDSVGMVNYLPLTGDYASGDVDIEGRTFPKDSGPVADKGFASPDYFQTMRIPLVRGRFFTDQDMAKAPPVAIINAEFARRYFSGEDPIGKRVAFGWNEDGFQEVVGVVGDVKHQTLQDPVHAEIYVPYTQRPDESFQIVMRTKTDPTSLVSAARAQVAALDSQQPITDVDTLEAVVSRLLTDQRTAMWLVGSFAALAMLLTIVGIYGVISYSVSQRTSEIGLRMALGAQPAAVLRSILREGLKLALAGVGIGLMLALLMTRWMASQLYGISARDPLTLMAVSVLLTLVALAACFVPARRAMRIDPITALRYE